MYIVKEELQAQLYQLKEQLQIIESKIDKNNENQKQFERVVLSQKKDNEILKFQNDWLTLENYELKILVIMGILAESNFAFRGKLDVICDWLGVQANSYNKNNIIKALEELKKEEYIFYKLDNKVYTITISEKAREQSQITKILKDWIIVFKNYNKDKQGKVIDNNNSVDWINVLKVFVFVYKNNNCEFTQYELADLLNIKGKDNKPSERIVSKALKAIKQCKLENISLETELLKRKYKEGTTEKWKTEGTRAKINYDFSE